MSFLSILNSLLLKPLELAFEVIYMMANRIVGNPGLSIIILSLAMNFLVLPLYKRADAMQEEERQMELKLHKGVTHIKKTFSGDEKMMILQTYYRQNNYKPTYMLRGAVSLLLEIPFFIAAYQFLSHLELLNGVSLGPIADLSRPDGLITIGGFTINVLPVIMTLINLISCIIFTKGSLLKTKIQLYGMAIFFLFFLYTSPSGLVFYWTLNNAFSLVKTIFYKLRHADKILAVLASAAGAAVGVYGLFFYGTPSVRRIAAFLCLAIALQIPLVKMLAGKKLHFELKHAQKAPDKKLFFAGGAFMSVLCGILIPSAVIKSSPQEFVDVNYFHNPVWYIVSAFCIAFGIFVIWMGIFYQLAKPSGKAVMDKLIWILCGAAIVDYMFFGKNLGIISNALKFENYFVFTRMQQLVNIGVLLATAAVLWVIVTFFKKHMKEVLAIATAAMVCMSVVNIVGINKSVDSIRQQMEDSGESARTTLSKDGKNVIVIMLDRAMGAYVPYIFNEKPELLKKFDGFTYYKNVTSFGKYTNFGTPTIFGGYEYTPAKMNARDTEFLVDKHNEALKVMPTVFSKNGYKVTLFDPTYAGYTWTPTLTVFNDCENVKAYNTKGSFTSVDLKKQLVDANRRNFFCYSLLKTSPLVLQTSLYDNGEYNRSDIKASEAYGVQTTDGLYIADGLSATFMDPYNVLESLPYITDISNSSDNTFLMMTNDTTHEPMLLQEPEYKPALHVDNTGYEAEHSDRFTLDGITLKMETDDHMAHYQANMASFIQLGNWFDYMKEHGVWDNTRIIIVSDHGRVTRQIDSLVFEDGFDILGYYSLFMVKDFNSTGFETNDDFMTIADVPTYAMKGLIDDPVNPFTGKKIDSSDKTAHDQYLIDSVEWDVSKNNGKTFLPAKWWTVHDNVLDKNNWKFISEDDVLNTEK